MLFGSTNETLFMLAVKRVPLGPWHLLDRKFLGHLLSPSPIVKKRFSSISVGTSTFLGLLKLLVKADAVLVSLKAGSIGITGLSAILLFVQLAVLQRTDLYSRIAVVVVLSNGAPCALK